MKFCTLRDSTQNHLKGLNWRATSSCFRDHFSDEQISESYLKGRTSMKVSPRPYKTKKSSSSSLSSPDFTFLGCINSKKEKTFAWKKKHQNYTAEIATPSSSCTISSSQTRYSNLLRFFLKKANICTGEIPSLPYQKSSHTFLETQFLTWAKTTNNNKKFYRCFVLQVLNDEKNYTRNSRRWDM